MHSAKELVSPESTLIYGRVADVISLDPPNQWDGTSSSVINNIYENLVQFKEGTADIEPWLAESWEISKDMLEYSLNFVKMCAFMTKPFLMLMQLFLTSNASLIGAIHTGLAAANVLKAIFQYSTPIKKIDEYTVIFKLERAVYAFY